MKKEFKIQYDKEYEILYISTKTDNLEKVINFAYFYDSIFRCENKLYYLEGSKKWVKLPDYYLMSEEELFQYELINNTGISVNIIKKIQELNKNTRLCEYEYMEL